MANGWRLLVSLVSVCLLYGVQERLEIRPLDLEGACLHLEAAMKVLLLLGANAALKGGERLREKYSDQNGRLLYFIIVVSNPASYRYSRAWKGCEYHVIRHFWESSRTPMLAFDCKNI
jgi:hypothetical protein